MARVSIFVVSIIVKISKWVLSVLVVLFLTIYFVRAFDSRDMPPLGPEHRIKFEQEFRASQESQTDWSEYLAIGSRLAIELDETIDSHARSDSLVDRHSVDSLTFPGNYRGNWNRSYEISAAAPRGVAVLLHGLTDSPYSMLSTAQTLAGAGYNVVVPRMPGHGFAVGALVQVRWEDWKAAIRVAIRHAMTLQEKGQPLLLVGYSNGGLLTVDYALECNDIVDLACPDGLVLLSPAIAVTPIAVTSNWHAVISWMPYFEKFKWLSILPEVDPFKFTSFPKRAGWEIYKISSAVHARLERTKDLGKMPPILTFQSVVDNTVSADAIVTNLYSRLPANGSELVVYDINRNNTLLHVMKNLPDDPVKRLESEAPLSFGVTILRNRNRNSLDINSMTLAAGDRTAIISKTNFKWPPEIYSLSHIALPFRSDDIVYGDGSVPYSNNPGIVFGALAPRGEPGLLHLKSDHFLRARYNPFYEFQASYLTEWLGGL